MARPLLIKRKMKKTITSPFLIFLLLTGSCFFSCAEKNKNEDGQIAQKLDSLTMKVDSLSRLLAKKDSPAPDTMVSEAAQKAIAKTPELPFKEEKKLPEKTTAKPVGNPASDTTFYYYSGSPKRVSAIITPWKSDKRKVILFDPSGKKTFELEDVRMSYSSISTLNSFHANGSVEKLTVHDNPGASMYWYETYYTFGTGNEPLWRENKQFPVKGLEPPNVFYWDKNSSSWKKQETVHEQEVPH